ncbi:hypothetical protein RF11_00557 [Thelohanellus kitauei]|uniref:Uncharacterized protein n=1 Tax=Thelohanellus kitauei TaxID=669202 RepID=A0A0C2JXH7_THEKT|nr:hypothetical protein RF11_00557 [Thelohanellus kitauei]
MEAFEQFLSNRIHECVFTMENIRFYKTYRVQTILQENGRLVIYLHPTRVSSTRFKNLLSKWKKIVKTASSRSETDLINLIESSSIVILLSDCDGYYQNMLNTTDAT